MWDGSTRGSTRFSSSLLRLVRGIDTTAAPSRDAGKDANGVGCFAFAILRAGS